MGHDDPPGLPLGPLQRFLTAAAPGLLTGPLEASLVAGGKSNLTYAVTDGRRSVIVRRPPLGHVLATAHDMGREHRVMSALRDTAVPVPQMYAACPDPEVIGAPFYVMEHVAGTPYRLASELEALGAQRVRAISERMVDTLVVLHAVDPEAVGLGDFGRPQGFLARQVRRWKQQLDASRSREVPGIDELHARLTVAEPTEGPPGIVHGDFRLDNLLVDDDDRVRAVLDWEMATLGDPLTDVALLHAYLTMPAMVDSNAVSDASLAPGFLTPDETLDRYAAGSGRDLTHLAFHLGLAYFKLAVILEGIHYRHAHGQTVGAGFDSIGAAVEPLVTQGLRSLRPNQED
ncbi:MAG: phosphotransferase family protein [Intrasporangium sp.]|uniref:phosphotransferase family protein n=1 Tax=Intrasporangium sp. TaxID=1925024 RepID=UPI0026485D65|nr:phosphotransferase family protein [Intrasporangium sp.]MDN5795746.1 phosphotransferase family protein [Intrasporangium sp.]